MSTKRIIYKMQVEEVLDLTSIVRDLVVRCVEPTEFKFRAGQFVMLHVPQADKPALRAYSIASAEQTCNGFRLLFKAVQGGVATTFVWNLKKGDMIDFTGPFGRVFFNEPPPAQVVFLSTSSGLAPHLCYLESKASQYPQTKFRLFCGVQKESDIFCKDDLEDLKRRLPNLSYDFVLSRADDNWKGLKGYVQQQLGTFDWQTIPTEFYLCGNGQMIKDTKAILLESNKVEPTKIHSEAFD